MFSWDITVGITSEYDLDGFLTIAHDSHGKNGGVSPGEAHHPFGTFGRARDADLARDGTLVKGGNVMIGWEGSTPHFVVLSDPRSVPKLPRHKLGGYGIYADTGKGQLPYAVFDGETGSFTLYVPYEFSGDAPGKAMAISVDVTNAGDENLQIVHGSGSVVSMLADGSVSIVAADKGSSVTVSNGGAVTVNGNTVVNGGVTLGSPAGALPVAIAPYLVAYLQALELNIGAAILAVGPAGLANGASGATAFAGTAVARAALMTAIAAHNTSAF